MLLEYISSLAFWDFGSYRQAVRKNSLMKSSLVFALVQAMYAESLIAIHGDEASFERTVLRAMQAQRKDDNRALQVIREPGPRSLAVGYVLARSEQATYSVGLALQKRRVAALAERKGWKLIRWYEEPEQREKKVTAQRPVLAQLLSDARSQFQVVLCSTYKCWARGGRSAYVSLDLLRRLGVWWATANEQWDINTVWQEGIDVRIILRHMRLVNRYLASMQAGGKEEN